MVFGDFVDNNGPRDEASRLQALRAANCIKILGKGVIRVVHRVDDARENNTLGEFYLNKPFFYEFHHNTQKFITIMIYEKIFTTFIVRYTIKQTINRYSYGRKFFLVII